VPADATDVVLSDPPTIRRSLDEASRRLADAAVPSPRLDARLLLGAVLGLTKEEIIVREHEPVSWSLHSRFESLVDRRLTGEPVAYLRGIKEFWSLELEVDRSVLIPRPDTEALVEACLEGIGAVRQGDWAVDCGTGSGAVAIALARSAPDLRVLALDISLPALAVAARNVGRHDLTDRVALAAADLITPVGRGPRCIAANLPYIPTAEIDALDPGIRDHEPRIAIDGGADGLDLVRRLAEQAPGRLAPGGLLALEVADSQAEAVERMLGSSPAWRDIRIDRDLGRLKRVVTARRNA
jgi:release factor glutamine methyltransferase